MRDKPVEQPPQKRRKGPNSDANDRCSLPDMTDASDIRYGPGPLKGLRVLVAEDDAWAAERLSVMLEEEGARLLGPCRSVAEARRLLQNNMVQFVLIDLALADNFADDLVADAIDRDVPFAIITGYESLPTNIYDGAVATIRKPIEKRRLISLLTLFA
jgi:DNA-binding NtrC family response regulator